MMFYFVGVGDVLAYIHDMISKIVSVFTLIIHFIFSGISFLWNACTWIFSFAGFLPPWISGLIFLSVCIAIVLLIVGR